MLDKSIPYHNIIMRRPPMPPPAVPTLPPGYALRMYCPGDDAHWARIETPIGEFDSEADALAYFAEAYLPYPEELPRRVVFATGPDGLPAATASAWFAGEKDDEKALVHWVGCHPAHQNLGLGRAVVEQTLILGEALHPGAPVWLHTQTWSHKAIGLYHRLGFRVLKADTFDDNHSNDYTAAMPVLQTVLDEKLYRALADAAE